MGSPKINISGCERRGASDNRVMRWPGPIPYRGHKIDYRVEPDDTGKKKGYWYYDGKKAGRPGKQPTGSFSDLHKCAHLNRETHDLGLYLERYGCVFKKPFHRG